MRNCELKRAIAGVSLVTLILIIVFVALAVSLTTRYDIATRTALACPVDPTPYYAPTPAPTPRRIKHDGQVKSGTLYLPFNPSATTWADYGFTKDAMENDYDTLFEWLTYPTEHWESSSVYDGYWNNSAGVFYPAATPPASPGTVNNLSARWTDGNDIPPEDEDPNTWGGSSDDTPSEAFSPTAGEVTVILYRVSLKSIEFISDHQEMNNNNSDWTGSGSPMSVPEWNTSPVTNVAISQSKNTQLSVKVTVKVEPAGLPFELIGVGSANYFNFHSSGYTSDGNFQYIQITSDASLPNMVKSISSSNEISWYAKFTNNNYYAPLGESGPHIVYVTYAVPIDTLTITEKRLSSTCAWATDAITDEDVANGIQNVLSSDPPYDPGDGKNTITNGWELMAGGDTYGQCLQQANLMGYALNMQGISFQAIGLVRASTNAGAGNCLDYEDRNPSCPVHGPEKLNLDFSGTLNEFEACCNVAGFYYAVWPKLKATNDYTMLQLLGNGNVTQHYCWWDNSINYYHRCDQPNSIVPIPTP